MSDWKTYPAPEYKQASSFEQRIVYDDGQSKVSLDWYGYDFSAVPSMAPYGMRYELEIYIPEELSLTGTTTVIHLYTYFGDDSRNKATDDAIEILSRVLDITIDWE